MNFGPGDGACVATVQLSDGQVARLRYAVGDRPQVIENVRIIGLGHAGSPVTADQNKHAAPTS
jgi:hypothetical protein